MATFSVVRSVHDELDGTDVDIVNLLQTWERIEVKNRSETDPLFFRYDGVDPVLDADETTVVDAGESVVIHAPLISGVTATVNSIVMPVYHQIRVIGTATDPFSVEGLAGR